jgi:hypothetical protein
VHEHRSSPTHLEQWMCSGFGRGDGSCTYGECGHGDAQSMVAGVKLCKSGAPGMSRSSSLKGKS